MIRRPGAWRALNGTEGWESMAQSGEARAVDMRSGSMQGAREPSMEEILASIKRIIEDTDNVRRPQSALDEPFGSDALTDAEASLDLPPADNDARGVGDSRDAAAFRDGLQVSEDSHGAAPAVSSPASRATLSPEPLRAAPAAPEARPAIISDHAGRQVAAAFEELSDAFAASRKRSFDEIAEEMMRPMLQDWLDNNLPTLVERLVREEIERVARGG